jgi:hypothetical protein
MKDLTMHDDEMPPEIDFSKGVRGIHHISTDSRVFVPASIERGVWEYFSGTLGTSERSTEAGYRD